MTEEETKAEANTSMEMDMVSRLEQKWEGYVSLFRKGKKTREKAVAEAKAKAEHEARVKAELEAKLKAEREAKEKAELEAKDKAEWANNAGKNESLNHALWKRFSGATTDKEFCYNWLDLQSGIIDGVNGSVIVLGPSEKKPFSPIAFWPADQRTQCSLTTITNRVLKEQKKIVIKNKSGDNGSSLEKKFLQVASPIRIDRKLYGAVAMEITDRSQDHLQEVTHRLQRSIVWLEKWIISNDSNNNIRANERLACAVDLIAHTLQEDRFQAACTSFVTLLATRLGCDRVSIGFMNGKKIKIHALSHSAQFRKQMNLVRSICSVMEESVDQQKILNYPVISKEGCNDILRAHDDLAKQQKHITICTIPFINNKSESYGALTLERSLDKPFDNGVVELCDSITALVAPVLEEKRRNDRLLIKKTYESLYLQVGKLTGSGRMSLKFFALLGIITACFIIFARGEYRVTAKSTVEGKIQQAIVAPYSSYIHEAYVRAGDSVKKEQVMCKLDDRDFRLEHTKLENQRKQYSKQHRKAMAIGKRADMKILKEQINQTDTQLALLDEQLSRTKLLATFDGMVVSGDLSQSLGTPVELGQVLFVVSPLNDYRVKLEVDEREISRINVGQTGRLVLNALPKTQFPVTVEKITPVSTTEEGVNFFHVEARLDETSERLRPGMEGFGKISVERNRLIWIWTHGLTDWLRLWSWSWWP